MDNITRRFVDSNKKKFDLQVIPFISMDACRCFQIVSVLTFMVFGCCNRKNLEDDVYNFGYILLESLVGPIVTGREETFLLNDMVYI